MQRQQITTRRQFLHQAGALSAGIVAAPMIVPSSALGRDGATAPSERIVMGTIGTGGMGRGNTGAFMGQSDVQMVAVCDVDAKHLMEARDLVNNKYGNQDCTTYRDFRELLDRDDIDAVVIATPDHWHGLISVAAARKGKDMYTEKPLTNSIGEGRAVCEAVKENERILPTGSHERSGGNARFACELVRNGRIGQLHTIQINLPCDDEHHLHARQLTEMPPEQPVPEQFDYDFWLGHTPKAPYMPQRCHFWWRFVLAHGGGEMTDRGAHVIDIGQLGGDFDDTGPVEIEARGVRTPGSLYDVFWDYEFVNTFANGVRMIGKAVGPRGVRFEGDEGWVFVHIHGGKLEASDDKLLQSKIGEKEIQLGRSPDHRRNFLDSVKSRQDPVAPAEVGHRTGTICHLNNIAMLLGRKLKWDPKNELFVGDDEANKLIHPRMREPWTL
jgi:predicted dehydrogenase